MSRKISLIIKELKYGTYHNENICRLNLLVIGFDKITGIILINLKIPVKNPVSVEIMNTIQNLIE